MKHRKKRKVFNQTRDRNRLICVRFAIRYLKMHFAIRETNDFRLRNQQKTEDNLRKEKKKTDLHFKLDSAVETLLFIYIFFFVVHFRVLLFTQAIDAQFGHKSRVDQNFFFFLSFCRCSLSCFRSFH